jgi:hypothetical protein
MLQHRLDSLLAVKSYQHSFRCFRGWRRVVLQRLSRKTKQHHLALLLQQPQVARLTAARTRGLPLRGAALALDIIAGRMRGMALGLLKEAWKDIASEKPPAQLVYRRPNSPMRYVYLREELGGLNHRPQSSRGSYSKTSTQALLD